MSSVFIQCIVSKQSCVSVTDVFRAAREPEHKGSFTTQAVSLLYFQYEWLLGYSLVRKEAKLY